MSSPPFEDRRDAGRQLAALVLARLPRPLPSPIVLALPRGGVPVAHEVARALHAPLDVFVVRKLGVPAWDELAMGAVASGGIRVLDDELIARLGLASRELARVEARERQELARREALYRAGRPPLALEGRTVIVVDDGVATGTTMTAALRALRLLRPARLVVAVPVAPPDTLGRLDALADEVLCLRRELPLHAVGASYRDFAQTTDAEVLALLATDQGGPPLA